MSVNRHNYVIISLTREMLNDCSKFWGDEEEEGGMVVLQPFITIYRLFKSLYSHSYRVYSGKKGETEFGYRDIEFHHSHPGSFTCPEYSSDTRD